MTLFFISFIAGVLTVLAPCILPLLPVIVGGSVANGGNRKKSFTIIASLIISIVLFTLLLKWSTAFVHIPPSIWNIISGGILILVALSILFPNLWDSLPFVNSLSINSNKALGAGYQKKSLTGDVIIGAALGPVFSSCSPTYFVILATVLPQSFGRGLFYLFAYALGLGLILLLVSLLGQKIVDKLGGVADSKGIFKRIIGILFLLVGIFIITGLDKKIESNLILHGYTGLSGIEQKLLEKNDNKSATAISGNNDSNNIPQDTGTPESLEMVQKAKAKIYAKYHEIAEPDGFVNTDNQPIKISDYIGKKVILLDFVTYSCINCQRTFPYLVKWYKAYEDKGLIIIGIHTPEFAFEHDIDNVRNAMKKFGITFPLVLDNNYGTWNAYGNQYWPRKYLIDIDGFIVYDHIGEGKYDETEAKIVQLLDERATRMHEQKIVQDKNTVNADTPSNSIFDPESPETYLGTERSEYNASAKGMCSGGVCTYAEQVRIPRDRYAISGRWSENTEYIRLEGNEGSITYHFNAKKVHIVAEASSNVVADIYIDGKKIPKSMMGTDVSNGSVTFKEPRLYTLTETKAVEEHTLQIKIHGSGFKGYAFTFS